MEYICTIQWFTGKQKPVKKFQMSYSNKTIIKLAMRKEIE